jgi:hypothetical protein
VAGAGTVGDKLRQAEARFLSAHNDQIVEKYAPKSKGGQVVTESLSTQLGVKTASPLATSFKAVLKAASGAYVSGSHAL